MTDATGAGTATLHNVVPVDDPFIGTAVVTVTANGVSVSLQTPVNCPSAKGD